MSTAMSLERKHIPPLPTYLTILRIVQLVLGIIILGISAYGVSVDPTPGLGLTIFTVGTKPKPTNALLMSFSQS